MKFIVVVVVIVVTFFIHSFLLLRDGRSRVYCICGFPTASSMLCIFFGKRRKEKLIFCLKDKMK